MSLPDFYKANFSRSFFIRNGEKVYDGLVAKILSKSVKFAHLQAC